MRPDDAVGAGSGGGLDGGFGRGFTEGERTETDDLGDTTFGLAE